MRLRNSVLSILLSTTVFAGTTLLSSPKAALAAGEESRKVKFSFKPEYPELARRMNIKGVARVQAVVNAKGDVVSVKDVGGNPVLLQALSRAVAQWKYEPAQTSSTVDVSYEFTPQ